MNREEILDRILRNITLTEQQQVWWEKHRTDKEIQDELAFLREMEEPLRIENRTLLKSQLKEIEGSQRDQLSAPGKRSAKEIGFRNWLSIAAAVALLLVAGILIFRNQEPDHFASHFDPYPSIINPVLKGGQNSNELTARAMQAYQNQKYEDALNHLEEMMTQNDTLLFYKANMLLSLERFPEALPILQKLTGHQNRFVQESAWYEALTLLGLKRKDEVVSLLKEIIQDTEHPYAE
ncbi:MAG: hypothetical protein OEQ53_21055, partial [Saprospiraceae bacterium]|nr:hypothetical protein [Saprospiraceae bacterium]